MYTTQNDFGPYPNKPSFVLTIKANGGSVALQFEHSPGVYVTSQTFSSNGAHQLLPGLAAFRLVPTGGAEYNLK